MSNKYKRDKDLKKQYKDHQVLHDVKVNRCIYRDKWTCCLRSRSLNIEMIDGIMTSFAIDRVSSRWAI